MSLHEPISNFQVWLQEQSKPRRLLLIDDSREDCAMIQEFTRPFNCDWSVARNIPSALTLLNSQDRPFSLVFLDLRLEERDSGTKAFAEIKRKWPSIPVVILSGYLDTEAIHSITSVGFALFAQKPTCFTKDYFDDLFRIVNIPARPN